MTKDQLLQSLREGRPLSLRQQLRLVALLSGPAMLAQLSYIAMQYIDATMVARLGADAMGAIGLVSTTLWLMGGLCGCAATGFYVLASHKIGAQQHTDTHRTLRVALPVTLLWSTLLMLLGWAISGVLPHWLGGHESICGEASRYFFIFVCILPLMQLNALASGMLRVAGNLKVPSYLNALMCLADVVFNYLFIYHLHMGVEGAALGTVVAEGLGVAGMLFYMFRQPELRRPADYEPAPRGHWRSIVRSALRIGAPMGMERIFFTGAQIATTVIVAPLGTIAIAANSLGITIEALCYMPGYGIGEAATTLVGQSYGARRNELIYSFSRITLWAAVVIMGLMGVVMYFGSPALMALMGPDAAVGSLCVEVLRIEAFAEPMYGASIICYYVFVALGDSARPAMMNLFSMWAVRITLTLLLAVPMGLPGVWLAMATELTFRGLIFLIRLFTKIKPVYATNQK